MCGEIEEAVTHVLAAPDSVRLQIQADLSNEANGPDVLVQKN